MRKPQFFATPGYGERKLKTAHYSQAVKFGHYIETSGQGGWNNNNEYPETLEDEIKQAFDNLTRTLQTAGASWEHVIHVHSYHVDFEPWVNDIMIGLFRHYMPDHQPLWTLLGVAALGEPSMRVEIRVTAIVPD